MANDFKWPRQVALAMAVGLTFASLQPVHAQPLPELPDVEQLVRTRQALVEESQRPGLHKLEFIAENDKLLDRLLIDRLNGSSSFGQGFVANSQESGEVITNQINQSSSNSWTISYKISLRDLVDTMRGIRPSAIDLEICQPSLWT